MEKYVEEKCAFCNFDSLEVENLKIKNICDDCLDCIDLAERQELINSKQEFKILNYLTVSEKVIKKLSWPK